MQILGALSRDVSFVYVRGRRRTSPSLVLPGVGLDGSVLRDVAEVINCRPSPQTDVQLDRAAGSPRV